jgi:hypothetical protein
VRRALRLVGLAGAAVLALALAAGALFILEVLSREPLVAVASTTHPSIERRECLDCHAPIAEEWRQSYHFRSLTGPYWKDVRELGYLEVFDRSRKGLAGRGLHVVSCQPARRRRVGPPSLDGP